MNREQTLEYIKDMISPAYFEDAVEWVLDNCDLDDNCENIPHIFGDHTPLQTAFEDYIKYLLFPIGQEKTDLRLPPKTEPAVVCVEHTHHQIYVADSEGEATDQIADDCWDDDPTFRVIDEGGKGEWLEDFGSDYEGAKKFCEDYNKEHYGE